MFWRICSINTAGLNTVCEGSRGLITDSHGRARLIFSSASRGQRLPLDWGDFSTAEEYLFIGKDFNCATASAERLFPISCFSAHSPTFLAFPMPSTCSLLHISVPETIPSASSRTNKKTAAKTQQAPPAPIHRYTQKNHNKKRNQGCEGSPRAGCTIAVDMLSASAMTINIVQRSFKGLDTVWIKPGYLTAVLRIRV